MKNTKFMSGEVYGVLTVCSICVVTFSFAVDEKYHASKADPLPVESKFLAVIHFVHGHQTDIYTFLKKTEITKE